MKDKGEMIKMIYYGVIALLVIIGFYKVFSHTTEEIEGDNSIVNLLINQGKIYAYIAFGLTIAAAIFGLITHFKQSIWALVGIGALLVIFGIAWSMSSTGDNAFLESFGSDISINGTESRLSEAGLKTMFILGGLGIIGAVASGVKSLFE